MFPLSTLILILINLNLFAIALLVLRARKDGYSSIYLIGFILAQMPLFIVCLALFSRGTFQVNANLVHLNYASLFLYGPCIFFWVIESINPSKTPSEALVRFLPHGTFFIIMLVLLITHVISDPYNYFAFRVLVKTHMIFYVAAALVMLWNHRSELLHEYSDMPESRLAPAIFIIGALLLLSLLELTFTLGWINKPFISLEAIVIARGVYGLALALVIIRAPSLIVIRLCPSEQEQDIIELARTDVDTAKAIIKDLNCKMQQEKFYLNSDLNLHELANNVSVNAYILSEAINKIENRNFYEYVNFYRVNFAKDLLVNQKYSRAKLHTICFESGFNNRTTFTNAFKKFTGLTPSQYRKTHCTTLLAQD